MRTGLVPGATDETWKAIDSALRDGLRGMTRGSSLARLLAEFRGVRNRLRTPPLTRSLILRWAEAYHRAKDRWPSSNSGPIWPIWRGR